MKKNKIRLIICCLLFLFNGFLLSARAAQNGGSALVCLLDASGSMRSNDRNRLAIDSISRLIYSLPSDCKAGVVAYNNNTAYQSELTSEAGRSELVDTVSKIKYGGYTNAGEGLRDAVELLKDDSSSKKTIIILSDGGIEGRTEEETEQSRKEFESALSEAVELKITIHVMGLGEEMADPENEIYTAGTATGGTNMQIKSDDQIAEAIDKISQESGTVTKDATYTVDAGQEESTLSVPFSYEDAVKARIVLSSDKNFDVLSVDAGGAVVTQNKGDLFAVIEVENPLAGDITIRIRGEGQVKADVFPEYNKSDQTAPAEAPSSETSPQVTESTEAVQQETAETNPVMADSGKHGKRMVVGFVDWVKGLKRYGMGAVAVMAVTLIAAVAFFLILTVSLIKRRKRKKLPDVLKIDIRGGTFGKKGYSLCYSLFCLLQQGEISLQEVLASGGVEEIAIGAENIRFEMEKKNYPVLINESDIEVRCRQKKVGNKKREKIPLLSTVKIFVENEDRGLIIKKLVIE